MPLWLSAVLNRLHSHIPNVVPYDALALTGIGWQRDVQVTNVHNLTAGLLLEKGWSVDQSVLVYKNFRLCHPQLRFDPQMLRTFSRKQLREELGFTYGDIVADVCSDPQAQPVFNALLFGTLDTPVPRAFLSHRVHIKVDGDTASNMGSVWDSTCHLHVDGLQAADIQRFAQPWTPQEAAQVYKQATGLKLVPGNDINPRSFDYDLAAIRAALRQADRPE